jgi:hypothetical protein
MRSFSYVPHVVGVPGTIQHIPIFPRNKKATPSIIAVYNVENQERCGVATGAAATESSSCDSICPDDDAVATTTNPVAHDGQPQSSQY